MTWTTWELNRIFSKHTRKDLACPLVAEDAGKGRDKDHHMDQHGVHLAAVHITIDLYKTRTAIGCI